MKSDKIPESWEAIRFGDIAYIKNGYAFPSTDFKTSGTVPLIKQSQLAGNAVCLDKCAYLDEKYLESHSDFVLQQGDVLIGMSGSIGKLCVYDLDTPALQNQRTGKIVARNLEVIDKEIFWFYLQTIENQLKRKGKGMGVANVSGGDIESLPFALPPLAEQRRIVAQLKATMQKLEASQERLDKLPDLLKKFRQAVLAAAVSGKLTEAWRAEQPQGETGADLLDRIRAERRAQWEDKHRAKLSGKQLSLNDSWKSKYEEPAAPDTSELPELPEGWVWTTMPMVGELNRGKSKHRPRNDEALYGGPYPFIQTGDVSRANRIIESYKQTYSELGLEQSKLWAKGTLCITIAANIADTAILGFDACFPDSIVGFLANPDRIEIDFVEFFLSTAKANIEHYAPATAQKNINLDILSQVAMPLPSYTEQQEIVRQVNHYFGLADQLETRLEQAAALVEQLPQALLAKAFSGQLVPQDPDDEPASVLLERLHAEPTTPVKGKRGRKAKVATEATLFD